MNLPLLDLVALAFLLVGLPVAAVAQLRLVDGLEIQRIPAYVSSVGTLLVLGVGAGWVGARKDGVAALGLGAVEVGPVAAWTAILVLAGLALVVAFRQVGMATGARESPLLRALMPRTPKERAVFAGLSLAAGVCEEVAYRGFALTTVAAFTGIGWAVGVTSLVFGILHAYQGWLGVARTASLGGLLAMGFVASGSLWAPMAAHVILDLVLGIVLADRLMLPEERTGVSTAVNEGMASPRE